MARAEAARAARISSAGGLGNVQGSKFGTLSITDLKSGSHLYDTVLPENIL